MKIIITLVSALLISSTTMAQIDPQVERDTARARGMRNLQQQIGLSDMQVTNLISLTKMTEQKVKAIPDSLSKDIRRQKLVSINEKMMAEIQLLLTPTQWQQYLEIDAQRKEAARKAMKRTN